MREGYATSLRQMRRNSLLSEATCLIITAFGAMFVANYYGHFIVFGKLADYAGKSENLVGGILLIAFSFILILVIEAKVSQYEKLVKEATPQPMAMSLTRIFNKNGTYHYAWLDDMQSAHSWRVRVYGMDKKKPLPEGRIQADVYVAPNSKPSVIAFHDKLLFAFNAERLK